MLRIYYISIDYPFYPHMQYYDYCPPHYFYFSHKCSSCICTHFFFLYICLNFVISTAIYSALSVCSKNDCCLPVSHISLPICPQFHQLFLQVFYFQVPILDFVPLASECIIFRNIICDYWQTSFQVQASLTLHKSRNI